MGRRWGKLSEGSNSYLYQSRHRLSTKDARHGFGHQQRRERPNITTNTRHYKYRLTSRPSFNIPRSSTSSFSTYSTNSHKLSKTWPPRYVPFNCVDLLLLTHLLQPASVAKAAPATASKAPAKSPAEKGAKKTAAKATPEGDKKKRKKARKETYSSYIYKGELSFHVQTIYRAHRPSQFLSKYTPTPVSATRRWPFSTRS
jgi:hypothetical protein